METLFIDNVFHYGQELHVVTANGLEKLIDFRTTTLTEPVHGAQRIEFHTAVAHHLHTAHHAVPRRTSALVDTERIVHILRSVERDSDKELVLTEKRAPFLVDSRTVGLERIFNPLSFRIFFLKLDGLAVVVHSQQRRFATVPAECHRVDSVGLDILAHIFLQQRLAHASLLAAILHRLVKIIAILTVQIAGRPRRLQHRRKSHRPLLLQPVFKSIKFCILHCTFYRDPNLQKTFDSHTIDNKKTAAPKHGSS